jgi:hypothetical protein
MSVDWLLFITDHRIHHPLIFRLDHSSPKSPLQVSIQLARIPMRTRLSCVKMPFTVSCTWYWPLSLQGKRHLLHAFRGLADFPSRPFLLLPYKISSSPSYNKMKAWYTPSRHRRSRSIISCGSSATSDALPKLAHSQVLGGHVALNWNKNTAKQTQQ